MVRQAKLCAVSATSDGVLLSRLYWWPKEGVAECVAPAEVAQCATPWRESVGVSSVMDTQYIAVPTRPSCLGPLRQDVVE